MSSKRADILLVELGFVDSRNKAKSLIQNKKVKYQNSYVKKASQMISEHTLEVDTSEVYVGRGIYKIEGACEDFDIDFKNKIVADVGASTGGFTEFALLKGARKVYAIDVGLNQLDNSLKQDSRVINLEGQNIRELDKLDDICDIAVVDLSFISLNLVIAKICSLISQKGIVLCLVKPQFEVGKENIGKNGIVKDLHKVYESLVLLKNNISGLGFSVNKAGPCKIKGKTGNQEYFFLIGKDLENLSDKYLEQLVNGEI